jgi:hypothetical protein
VDGAFFTRGRQVILFLWNFEAPQIYFATAAANGSFSITVSNALTTPLRYGAEWEDTLRAEDGATDRFSNIVIEQDAHCAPAGPIPAGLNDGP